MTLVIKQRINDFNYETGDDKKEGLNGMEKNLNEAKMKALDVGWASWSSM